MATTLSTLKGVIIGIALMIVAGFGYAAFGAITSDTLVQNEPASFKAFEFFTATTTTATSTNLTGGGGHFVVAGAKKIALTLARGGATSANTGTTVFRVQGTKDPSLATANWFYVTDIESSTSTATYTSDLALAVTAATTTYHVALDMTNRPLFAIRVVAVETTDGEHTASAVAEF